MPISVMRAAAFAQSRSRTVISSVKKVVAKLAEARSAPTVRAV